MISKYLQPDLAPPLLILRPSDLLCPHNLVSKLDQHYLKFLEAQQLPPMSHPSYDPLLRFLCVRPQHHPCERPSPFEARLFPPPLLQNFFVVLSDHERMVMERNWMALRISRRTVKRKYVIECSQKVMPIAFRGRRLLPNLRKKTNQQIKER